MDGLPLRVAQHEEEPRDPLCLDEMDVLQYPQSHHPPCSIPEFEAQEVPCRGSHRGRNNEHGRLGPDTTAGDASTALFKRSLGDGYGMLFAELIRGSFDFCDVEGVRGKSLKTPEPPGLGLSDDTGFRDAQHPRKNALDQATWNKIAQVAKCSVSPLRFKSPGSRTKNYSWRTKSLLTL